MSPLIGKNIMISNTSTLIIACVVTTGAIPRIANADDPPRGDSDSGEAIRSAIDDALRFNVQVGSSELNSGEQPEDSTGSTSPANDWRFDFHTWAWMLGIEGDIGARGLT